MTHGANSERKKTRSKDEKPYVIVAVGLDQTIYPSLAMNNDEAKKISQTLQSLLNLKRKYQVQPGG